MKNQKILLITIILLLGFSACGKVEPFKIQTENQPKATAINNSHNNLDQSYILSHSKCIPEKLFEPLNLNKIQSDDIKKKDGTYQLESISYYAILGLKNLLTDEIVLGSMTSNVHKSTDTYEATTSCYNNEDGMKISNTYYQAFTLINAKDLTANNLIYVDVHEDKSILSPKTLSSNLKTAIALIDSKAQPDDKQTLELYKIDENHFGIQLTFTQSKPDGEAYLKIQKVYSYQPETKPDSSKLNFNEKVYDFARKSIVLNHYSSLELANRFSNIEYEKRNKYSGIKGLTRF